MRTFRKYFALTLVSFISFTAIGQTPIGGGGGASGGTGTPGGSVPQIQTNAGSGNFGGITVSGDGTLNGTSGALVVTKSNGVSFGTAAFDPVSAFLQPSNNLSDVSSVSTSRTNLGLGTFATQNFATPPAIGGTTPAAGTFSSLTDSSFAAAGLVLNNSSGLLSTLPVVNGDCVVGSGGVWTSLACPGGSPVSITAGNVGIVISPSTCTGTCTISLGNPSATTLGGIESAAAVSHQWISSISTSGVPALTQPAFSDLSGSATTAQLPAAALTAASVPTVAAQCASATNTTTNAVSWITCPGGTSANPSATAGPTAVNGSATTYMRSDAAPAVQKAGASQFGIMQPDGQTVVCTATAGVCSTTAADRTVTVSTTIAATDMGGQVNFNGSSLTVTFPAISSTVLAAGMSVTVCNYASSSLTISSTPTINGYSVSSLPAVNNGVASCLNVTSNGTSLDGVPVNGAAILTPTQRTVSGTTDTLLSGDCNNLVTYTSSSAVSVTAPATFAVGCSIAIQQSGSGQVTVASTGSGTIVSTYTARSTAAQQAVVGMTVTANSGGSAAVWALTGGVTPDIITGNSFIPNSSTLPSNGVYLPATNTVGIATNTIKHFVLSDPAGHQSTYGTIPVVSACGTSPSIQANSTDADGQVTVGTTASSCTVTFGASYATFVHCVVNSESTLAAFAYSYTLSAITVTATTLGSDKFDYSCRGI